MSGRFGRSRRDSAPERSRQSLDKLLEEVHDLRLTLAVDLTTAAGAADAGAEDVARDIIDADRQELARFARVANMRLEGLTPRRAQPSPWRRRLVTAAPVVPVVGAMALSAAAATGALPLPGTHHAHRAAAPAVVTTDTSPVVTFQHLVSVLNSDPSASQVIAAASQLHKQLQHLILTSPGDPARAAEIAQLLQMEQTLLMREQPPGASIVLDATRKLAARLHKVAPSVTSPSVAPSAVPTWQPSPNTSSTHASPKPTPSASPSATPSPKPSPSASQSPSGSPSPSGYPFPRIPH